MAQVRMRRDIRTGGDGRVAEPNGQTHGHACPECGAARGADNTPSCGCGPRASEALRDARTAEQAAAEDFDPLRIRPYVELDGAGTPAAGDSAAGVPAAGDPVVTPPPGDAEPTMPLRPAEPEPTTTELPTTVLPTPLAPSADAPSASDLDLFEEPAREEPPAGEEPPGNVRRTVALLVAGAGVAVLVVVAVASGLFSYDTPSRNTALPTDVREAVPDARTTEPSRTPSPSTASASPTSASPSASVSASASPSPSPSPSSASPTPTPTSTPTPSATSARATASPEAPAESAPVLRRGDRGPEVTELQLRLRQLYLYNDEPDGHFDEPVEQALRNYQWSRGLQDELSVYGPKTRRMLEAETREP
jgi:hypothetical protein